MVVVVAVVVVVVVVYVGYTLCVHPVSTAVLCLFPSLSLSLSHGCLHIITH